ncbi:hypothetical protein [Alteromonas stellipolaris]|uniref:hypothetical protein n=1 Tax=Alteromonas stellipolaris TaxID=233316 RepID=UPI000B0A4E56|nr:hypothetical protein [Alteromonas stellipolaris]MDP2597604.1 hypothetical protein [Alteromonas stellipolaris]
MAGGVIDLLSPKTATDLAQRVGSTMIDLPPHGCGGRTPWLGLLGARVALKVWGTQ